MRRLLLIALAALTVAPTALAASQDVTLTMTDGVTIACTYSTPSATPPGGGLPAVMVFHGLGQTRHSLDEAAAAFGSGGYATLGCDARGHGESGGTVGIDGPREVADTKAEFEWLAGRPEIAPTRIGAFGISLGGGIIWNSALAGVPFAAIEPVITWTDLREALAPQLLVKSGAVLQFSQSVRQFSPELAPSVPQLLANHFPAAAQALFSARSVRTRLATFRTPTFMLQGRRDFAFDVEQTASAYRVLGGPKRLYLGDLGHAPATNPAAERPYFFAECVQWFDRFLKGIPNGIDTKPSVEIAPDPWTSRTARFRALPPTKRLSFAFQGGSLGAAGKLVRTSRPLPRSETYGLPTVTVRVRANSGFDHLVAVVSALTSAGKEIVVTEGGRGAVGEPGTISFRLMNEVTAIPPRSRIRLTLAATSTAQNTGNLLYLNAAPTGSKLLLGRVTLTLPVLRKPISR